MPTFKDFDVPESIDFYDVKEEWNHILELIECCWDELKRDDRPEWDDVEEKLVKELFTEKLSDWTKYRKKALEIMEIEGDWSVEV